MVRKSKIAGHQDDFRTFDEFLRDSYDDNSGADTSFTRRSVFIRKKHSTINTVCPHYMKFMTTYQIYDSDIDLLHKCDLCGSEWYSRWW